MTNPDECRDLCYSRRLFSIQLFIVVPTKINICRRKYGILYNRRKEGRVKPTLSAKAVIDIDDDHKLENKADKMVSKALQMKTDSKSKQ